MKKKYLLIGGGAVIFLVTMAAIFVRLNQPKTPTSVILNPLSEPTQPQIQLVVWEDPAGFKFSYPRELTMNNHSEDEENYANLELSANGRSGHIIVLMKESPYQTLAQWLKKEAGGDSQVLDSQLGGKPAKKVAFSLPKKLVTVALDAEALITIEGVFGDETYWQDAYNKIISSFEFTPLAGEEESSIPAGGSSAVVEEPEEIVE